MSLNASKLQEKIRRYPIPVVSGLVVLACLVNYYFRGDAILALEAERDQASREAMQIDQNIVAGTKLDVHLEELQSLAKSLGERVVNEGELAKNLNYFYGLEAATGVSISDLRQSSASEVTGIEEPAFVGIGYYVLLSGTFAQVVSYFDELENGSRVYQLKNFNLQRGRDANQELVTLSLNLRLLGSP